MKFTTMKDGEAWKIKDFPHFTTVGATAF